MTPHRFRLFREVHQTWKGSTPWVATKQALWLTWRLWTGCVSHVAQLDRQETHCFTIQRPHTCSEKSCQALQAIKISPSPDSRPSVRTKAKTWLIAVIIAPRSTAILSYHLMSPRVPFVLGCVSCCASSCSLKNNKLLNSIEGSLHSFCLSHGMQCTLGPSSSCP